jgi:hypothetical protein
MVVQLSVEVAHLTLNYGGATSIADPQGKYAA